VVGEHDPDGVDRKQLLGRDDCLARANEAAFISRSWVEASTAWARIGSACSASPASR
jgi:hypothetical protein